MNNLETASEKHSNVRTTSSWEVSPEVQEAVNKYITENPEKYKRAQEFGEFLMSHPVFNRLDEFKVQSDDVFGNELKFLEIGKLFKFYGVRPNELLESEIEVLKVKLGSNWKESLISEYGFTNDDFTS
jgi:hypothetical protein